MPANKAGIKREGEEPTKPKPRILSFLPILSHSRTTCSRKPSVPHSTQGRGSPPCTTSPLSPFISTLVIVGSTHLLTSLPPVLDNVLPQGKDQILWAWYRDGIAGKKNELNEWVNGWDCVKIGMKRRGSQFCLGRTRGYLPDLCWVKDKPQGRD